MTRLALLRHADTAWSREGRIQGQADVPLLKDISVSLPDACRGMRVVTSPLARCVQTAALIGAPDAPREPRLREMSWGDWDGLLGSEIEARWPGQMVARRQDHWNYVPPNGESYVMVTERARPALDDILALAATQPVAVFAHGGIGRVLRGLFLGAAQADILSMDQPQDAFYRLHGGAVERIA